MNSNPDKWKEGYKEFIRYCKEKIPYSEFEDMLINFRNYYLCISFDYDFDTKKFNNFIISDSYNPKLTD
jgi:hypothetical protein